MSVESRFSTFFDLDNHVSIWALVNSKINYLYSSAASYYCDALNAGVITRLEYDQAKATIGSRWHYVGD